MDNLNSGLRRTANIYDEMRGKYLTFFVDNQTFGIPYRRCSTDSRVQDHRNT